MLVLARGANDNSWGLNFIMKIFYTLLNLILLPLYFTVFILFLFIWTIFTISCIGPFLQYLCNLSDRRTLDRDELARKDADIRIIHVPGEIHACSDGQPYKIFAIYSEPKEGPSKYPPICIPNGLGATAVLISQMQERLVELGFTVLSFDRLGVGLSDENVSGQSPTAIDLVKEMEFVMNSVQPMHAKWILLGPSMGSIVAQCYMSTYPDKVVGFLNMDGLPYPFIKFHSSFMWAGFIYRIYASIIWTGVLRPFIGMALRSNDKMFACRKFPLKVVIAQMNQSRFFANVGAEMWTMMDCCEMAEIAWGKLSVLNMSKEYLEVR
jgi:pimeloyl-ACP methyl ester carboxylesterase